MTNLKQMLMSGGVLRMRPPYGPYVVANGHSTPVSEGEVHQAIKSGLVRPNGIDSHGVYLFAMGNQTNVQLLRNREIGKSSLPAIQPGMSLLRGQGHPGAGKDADWRDGLPRQKTGAPGCVGSTGTRRGSDKGACEGSASYCAGIGKAGQTNQEMKKDIAA